MLENHDSDPVIRAEGLGASMRYVYLGDGLTDPALVNRACDPVRRDDGKCIVSRRMASALVIFAGEAIPRVVKRRRLRVVERGR